MPKQNEKKKKRSFMEKVNPFDKESKARRARKKVVKSANKLAKAGKRVMADKKAKGTGGAIKKVSTKKSGDFVKYEKKSKAAGSFRSAFAQNCKGKSAKSTFTWDGRSYSCGKAKAKKPISRGGARRSDPA